MFHPTPPKHTEWLCMHWCVHTTLTANDDGTTDMLAFEVLDGKKTSCARGWSAFSYWHQRRIAFKLNLQIPVVNLGHFFDTLGQKKKDSLGLRHSRGLARAHVVRDVPTVLKFLCRHGYDWATVVIKKELFCISLQSGPEKVTFVFVFCCCLDHISFDFGSLRTAIHLARTARCFHSPHQEAYSKVC